MSKKLEKSGDIIYHTGQKWTKIVTLETIISGFKRMVKNGLDFFLI